MWLWQAPYAEDQANQDPEQVQQAQQPQQAQQELHDVDLKQRSPVELEGDTFYDTLDSARHFPFPLEGLLAIRTPAIPGWRHAHACMLTDRSIMMTDAA